MEQTPPPVKKQQLQLSSHYELHQAESIEPPKTKDGKLPTPPVFYLHKNGIMSFCPFMSGGIKKDDTMSAHPCGTLCQFFNLAPQKVKMKEGDKEVEKETGKLVALLGCGSGVRLPIANIDLKKESSQLSVAK